MKAWLTLLFAAALGGTVNAAQYTVRINTTRVAGTPGALAIDFLADTATFHEVTIRDFSTDGTTGLPETEGGLVTGDLIELENPADFTEIDNGFFFNQVIIPFTRFGKEIVFTLQTQDGPVSDGGLPSEVSVFLLDEDRNALFPTGDPLGADALLALCITGDPDGDLQVFSPASLKPGAVVEATVPPLKFVTVGTLTITDPLGRPASRKATFKSSEPSLVLPASDPTVNGASVRIFNSSGLDGRNDDVTYNLPAGADEKGKPFWKPIGNPATGYSYTDSKNVNGPVSKLSLKVPPAGKKSLSFTAQKDQFQYTLNETNQTRVSVIVSFGGEQHRVDFLPSGAKPVDRPGLFKGSKTARKQ
jgi:hypothetical protein